MKIYSENKLVLTYSYSFYDTVSNLDFCDFCEQGERLRCSQNSGNLVYLQYSHKTLYYFEFLNSLPVSEHLIYLCSNPFELPKFSLRLCILPRCFNLPMFEPF